MSKLTDVVPAIMFIGQVVRVSTKIQQAIPSEQMGDSEEFATGVEEMANIALLGTVLDSDGLYLTLGTLDEEGFPSPKFAIKHEDIQAIQLYEENVEDMLDMSSTKVDSSSMN